MKIIISEGQLNNLIIEQQSVVKITDCKKLDTLDNLVNKYCKPIPVRKDLVDLEYKNLITKIQSEINNLFVKTSEIIKNSGLGSYLNDINGLKPQITEKLNLMYKQMYYANFGLMPPLDYTKAYGEIYDLIFNVFINKITKNFFIRNMLNMYVTKKNVDSIVNQFNSTYDQYIELLDDFIGMYIPQYTYISALNVENKMNENGLKCDKILVTVDGNCGKLPPNQQYHPPVGIIKYRETINDSTEQLNNLKMVYKKKIETIIRNAA